MRHFDAIQLRRESDLGLQRNGAKRRSTTQRRMNFKYLPVANRPAVVVVRVFCVRACSVDVVGIQTKQFSRCAVLSRPKYNCVPSYHA